jgi:hypothetical protein
MKRSALVAAALAAGLSCASLSAADAAPDHHWKGGAHNPHWDPSRSYDGRAHGDRRLSRNDYVYRGHDGRYYCRRSDGTTGLVVGGLAGGLIGNAIGGDTLGTVLGAAGGAFVGHSIDSSRYHCR